jgi:hypothetical protein
MCMGCSPVPCHVCELHSSFACHHPHPLWRCGCLTLPQLFASSSNPLWQQQQLVNVPLWP